MFADLVGLPLAEAYQLGDLNADSRNNEFDFELFKSAFDAAQGTGAFDDMLARVPEPTTVTLAVLGVCLGVVRRWFGGLKFRSTVVRKSLIAPRS